MQADFILDELGNCLVSQVMRFENLQAGFSNVCRKISIHCDLLRFNVFLHNSYRKYYNYRRDNW